MSQKRNKIILASATLLVSLLIILVINSKNSALNTVKQFYNQYTSCIESSQIDNCITQLKTRYGNLASAIGLFSINSEDLKDFPINARKLSVGSNFYQVPYLKDPKFNKVTVLIDDDTIVQSTWAMAARQAGVTLMCYPEAEAFLNDIDNFEKQISVYIDSNQ